MGMPLTAAAPDNAAPTTWAQIMADLSDRDWTQRQLCAYLEQRGVKCGQTTLSDLARGKSMEPSFSLGTALKKLHASKRKPPVRTTP